MQFQFETFAVKRFDCAWDMLNLDVDYVWKYGWRDFFSLNPISTPRKLYSFIMGMLPSPSDHLIDLTAAWSE